MYDGNLLHWAFFISAYISMTLKIHIKTGVFKP